MTHHQSHLIKTAPTPVRKQRAVHDGDGRHDGHKDGDKKPPRKSHASGYTQLRLTHKQFHMLCVWVQIPGKLDGVMLFEEVAKRASEDLKFPISKASIPRALETAGVKMPENSVAERRKSKGGHGPELRQLASYVVHLATKLGEVVPDHIYAIYNKDS